MSESVYLDATVFVTAALDRGRIGESARRLIAAVVRGERTAATATLTVDELLWATRKALGREDAARAAEQLFAIPNLSLVDITSEIASQAIHIIRHEGFHPRDAVHLACARARKLKVIVSSDVDFDRAEGMRRLPL